jgi:hypothetical protein
MNHQFWIDEDERHSYNRLIEVLKLQMTYGVVHAAFPGVNQELELG